MCIRACVCVCAGSAELARKSASVQAGARICLTELLVCLACLSVQNVRSLGLPDGWELAALSILAVKKEWAVFVFACGCVCARVCETENAKNGPKTLCVAPLTILTLAKISYMT